MCIDNYKSPTYKYIYMYVYLHYYRQEICCLIVNKSLYLNLPYKNSEYGKK